MLKIFLVESVSFSVGARFFLSAKLFVFHHNLLSVCAINYDSTENTRPEKLNDNLLRSFPSKCTFLFIYFLVVLLDKVVKVFNICKHFAEEIRFSG